jgi:hypothetical protein
MKILLECAKDEAAEYMAKCAAACVANGAAMHAEDEAAEYVAKCATAWVANTSRKQHWCVDYKHRRGIICCAG